MLNKIKRVLAFLLVLVVIATIVEPSAVSAAVKRYKVVFYRYDRKTVVKQFTVEKGRNLVTNWNMDSVKNMKFVSWDKSTSNVTKDMKVYPIYKEWIPYVEIPKTVVVGQKFNIGGDSDMYTKYKTTWASSDKKVATISSKGVVKALKAGTTTLRFTATKKKDRVYVFVCNLTVTTEGVIEDYVDLNSIYECDSTYPHLYITNTIKIGETVKLNSNNSDYGDEFSYYTSSSTSEDPHVKVSDDGTITGVSIEETCVYATVSDYSEDECLRCVSIVFKVVGE